ncbi:hypothetical protein EFO70_06245 [Lacticaseibacillus rhamnosus]|nr:hypothetical protein [Lacticaseibacillus rhamnosus]MCT3181128.1 hypothetical protein [Lacticaseibacillus rhamnosus]
MGAFHLWKSYDTPITRSPAQELACKDLDPQWPKTGHWGSRPLTLQLLNAPVRASKKKDRFRPFPY